MHYYLIKSAHNPFFCGLWALNMLSEYDVIVIGGGVAGTVAALYVKNKRSNEQLNIKSLQELLFSNINEYI